MSLEPAPSASPHLPLIELARRLGSAVWLERRLFEVLGAWVPSTAPSEAKLVLGAHSRHAAWRAEQLTERLPELRELPAEELVAPAGRGVADALDVLASLTEPVERLGALYRVVVPRQRAVLRLDLDLMSRVSAGPVRRTLGLVLDDLVADADAGEVAFEHLVAGTPDVAMATSAMARVEQAIVAAGGLTAAGEGAPSA